MASTLRFGLAVRAGAVALLGALASIGLAQGCALELDVTPPDVTPEGCTDDAHCDDDNPCTIDGCGPTGLCVYDPAPDGQAPGQVGGDCNTAQCTNGAVIQVPNADDVEDDGNSCTIDTCSAGGPQHQDAPSGTVCTIDGAAGTCDAFGGCVVECTTTADCDTGNPCNPGVCDEVTGECKFDPLDGHPEVFTQVSGDCRVLLCVAGAQVNVVDDGDLPSSATDCDSEICQNGVPSNPPLGGGVPCGAALENVCDGNGACVQCLDVAHCQDIPTSDLPPDSSCGSRACDANHVCVFQNSVPDGTEVDIAAGDCKQYICQAGVVTTQTDGGDLPNDGNDCTADSCSGSDPMTTPLNGTACGMGLVCITGNCQCQTAMMCPTGVTAADPMGTCRTPACSNGVCGYTYAANGTLVAGVQTAGDCKKIVCDGSGNVVTVNDDIDLPVDANACTLNICSNGVPSNPAATGAACQIVAPNDGVCSAAATCVQCNQASDCNDNFNLQCAQPTCVANACVPNYVAMGSAALSGQTAGNCQILQCNGSGGILGSFADNGDLPNDNNACTTDTCVNGNPTFTNVGQLMGSCSPPAGGVCDGAGACKAANGAVCAAASTCASGFCVDGHCCENACTTACRTCNNGTGTCQNIASGTDTFPANACVGCSTCNAGACSLVPDGMDTNNFCAASAVSTCGLDGSCNGANACRFWNNATVCNPTSCSGGVLFTQDLCNGSGACVDSGSTDCGNYACSSGTMCGTTCTLNSQCDTGVAYCETTTNTCDAKLANGTACPLGAASCSSGNCVDGVCCDSTCTGTCRACTSALKGNGANGVCGFISGGTDPQNECTPSACSAGSQTPSASCNGAAASCAASDPCGNYACGASACKVSCTVQADCIAAAWCDTGTNTCLGDFAAGVDCMFNEQCLSNTCNIPGNGKCA